MQKGRDEYSHATAEAMIAVEALSAWTQDTCFCVAEWLFASKYWTLSLEIPYMARGLDIPKELQQRNGRIIKTVVILMVLSCTVADALFGLFCHADFNGKIENWRSLSVSYITLTQFVYLTNIVSGSFLVFSLQRIQRELKKIDDVLMDSNVVAMHVAAYLTYVFSLFLYDGFYANNIISRTDHSQHLESMSSIAQTVLNMAS